MSLIAVLGIASIILFLVWVASMMMYYEYNINCTPLLWLILCACTLITCLSFTLNDPELKHEQMFKNQALDVYCIRKHMHGKYDNGTAYCLDEVGNKFHIIAPLIKE